MTYSPVNVERRKMHKGELESTIIIITKQSPNICVSVSGSVWLEHKLLSGISGRQSWKGRNRVCLLNRKGISWNNIRDPQNHLEAKEWAGIRWLQRVKSTMMTTISKQNQPASFCYLCCLQPSSPQFCGWTPTVPLFFLSLVSKSLV